MKNVLISFFCFGLFFSVCFADDKVELKDEKDKVSYSIGYQIGGDFKGKGVELNPALLVKGIQDSIAGTAPIMTPEEMSNTIFELRKKITAADIEQRRKTAEKNLSEGKKFMEENAKKEGVKTLPSGLQYKVIKEGSGAMPKATDTITAHYRGTTIDGAEFDSSYSRGEPAAFQLNMTIKGWIEALQLMKEGAKWQIFIPPDLAYGEQELGRIQANSTLIFEVELISVKTADKTTK